MGKAGSAGGRFSVYILYGGRFTRALITEMVMAEGGIPYEVRDVDIVAQEHRRPEYLAVNPSGWVPALVTPEGEILYETPAISLYLAERHRLTHLAPAIGDPDRGLFLSGFFSVAGDLEPILKRYFYPHRYVMREDDSAAMKERALGEALERLQVTEGRLHGRGPYHLGERFSLVDLTLCHWTAPLLDRGVLAPCPALRRCLELVTARPKLRPHFERQKAWNAEYAGMQARGAGVR